MQRETMVKESLFDESGDLTGYMVHKINSRDGDPRGGWYRQIGAKEGLVERTLKRWYYHWHHKKSSEYNSSVKYSRFFQSDMKSHAGTRARYMKLLDTHDVTKEEIDKLCPELQFMEHDSVWAFFDHIGYNHKDKRVSYTDKFINKVKR